MVSANMEWCNNNEGRAYPIREEATAKANNGRVLPMDIIADLGIIVPAEYGDVYVSSVRVTPRLYSIALACPESALLAVTVNRNSYEPYSAVAMAPLADNVSGWVVFGAHRALVAEHYVFDTIEQSGLEGRCRRIVERVPVRRILRRDSHLELFVDQLVKMLGVNGLSVTKESDDTIALTMDPALAPSYAGPCNQYADSANGCGIAPIRSINGVSADENGILTIRFVPFDWEPEE